MLEEFEIDIFINTPRQRRPDDFKRRILQRITTNKRDMFVAESKWLSMISGNDLGVRYYNQVNKVINHWTMDPSIYKQVVEKLRTNRLGKGPTSTSFKPGEHRSLKTEFKKGNIAHNKGLTLEEQYGNEKAATIRQKQSIAKKNFTGNQTSWVAGQTAWNKGMRCMWITDGINTKRVYNDVIPHGWKRGRTTTRSII